MVKIDLEARAVHQEHYERSALYYMAHGYGNRYILFVGKKGPRKKEGILSYWDFTEKVFSDKEEAIRYLNENFPMITSPDEYLIKKIPKTLKEYKASQFDIGKYLKFLKMAEAKARESKIIVG